MNPKIFRIVLISVILTLIFTCCTEEKEEFISDSGYMKFCGWSTFGNCSSDTDCIESGCNKEVCQSELEEKVVTGCEFRECYDANLYSLNCLCIEKKCQWAKYLDLSPEEAHSLIQTNLNNPDFMIIDVRTHNEYISGHIKNAVNIDYNSEEFFEKIDSLNRTKSYLVYCRSGHRSSLAVKIMKELGFIEVYNLKTGIIGWNERGFPVVKESPDASLLLSHSESSVSLTFPQFCLQNHL